MKKKIFSLLVLLVAAVSGAWAQDKNSDCADNCPVADKAVQASRVATAGPRKAAAAEFGELELSFNCTSGYQYGVATDGEYIYTSSWSDWTESMFFKYDMEGNFIEEFNIAGCGYLRGMAYDGEYFYGVANGNIIYQVDFESKTLVGTINIPEASMRSVTYDPKRDGFWVITSGWDGTLKLYDRDGNLVQEGAYVDDMSDIAYFEDEDGEEHILQFRNNNYDAYIYDYNITTNTQDGPVFNYHSLGAFDKGSGGCFIGEYNGQVCFFGDIQMTPNFIGIVPIANAKKIFDLTKADGAEAHGTVKFNVGTSQNVTTAQEGDQVTVAITPAEGWCTKEVTARGYVGWEVASSRQRVPMTLLDDLTVTGEGNAWTFDMPAANALVNVTYKKLLTNQDILVVDIDDVTYNGHSFEPNVTVKDGETVLTLWNEQTQTGDYSVSYENNTNAGTGKVIITGKGEKYAGQVEKTFEIEQRVIEEEFIATIYPLEYSGEPVTPKPDVTYNGMKLVEGVDYTVSYENNIETGIAYLTVTGIGNYIGSATVPFNIDLVIYMVYEPVNAHGRVYTTSIYEDKVVKVTVACIADPGYELTSLTGKTSHDVDVVLTKSDVVEGDTVYYTFVMPYDNVFLSPVFTEASTTGLSEEFFAEQSGKAEQRVKSEEFAPATCYDLNGRKVNGQLKKGVYIINGRKVVIK